MPEGRIFFDKDRNVVPRWRDFRTTVALGELNSADAFEVEWDRQEEDFLSSKLRAWEGNKSVPFAADLISAAFVLGRSDEAKEAAKFILEQREESTQTLNSIASQILSPLSDDDRVKNLEDLAIPKRDQLRKSIHNLRLRLRDEPRNAIAHVELARAYTLLDQREPAKAAMRRALKLAPSNRFVLRSASRLFIHTGDLDEAHLVLRNADPTKHDPWLLSAEIAAASAADRTPRFARAGQRLLIDLSDSPSEITELASALATLELSNSRSRDARKLFRTALISPTENSLAQVEWASRRIAGLDFVESTKIDLPRNHEAQAWEHFTNGNWNEALRESLKWLYDQPFSRRPAHIGSFIASSVLMDLDESERIIKFALATNQNDSLLLNNLAFTYASAGRVQEAEDTLSRIRAIEEGSSTNVAVIATKGLIYFRSGRHAEGRALYKEALEQSQKYPQNFQAMAALYYAREELIANSAEAHAATETAMDLSKGLDDKHIIALRNQVTEIQKKTLEAASGRS